MSSQWAVLLLAVVLTTLGSVVEGKSVSDDEKDKCDEYFYFDHGTQLCEHCSEICDFASVTDTDEQCRDFCPDYRDLNSKQCRSDEYFTIHDSRCHPCWELCGRLGDTAHRCQNTCRDLQSTTARAGDHNNSPVATHVQLIEPVDPQDKTPSTALPQNWIVVLTVLVVVVVALLVAGLVLFACKGGVRGKYDRAPQKDRDVVLEMAEVTEELQGREQPKQAYTETQPGVRSQMVATGT